MSNLNIAVYSEDFFYPPNLTNTTISQVQESGFTTLILGLFHIGGYKKPQIAGDIYFNNTLIISKGKYLGDKQWLSLIAKTLGGSLTKICASIGGGGGVVDYQSIKKIYIQNGNSFNDTNLKKNFALFKDLFPTISIIDLDCEETYDNKSFIAFCQMLIEIGFDITFCPYTNQSFWVDSLQVLNQSNYDSVKWWNLQCYDGGSGNDPKNWAGAIKKTISEFNTNQFIIAGDWSNDTPEQLETLMSSFNTETSIGGGFLWTLDQIIQQNPNNPLKAMKAYVNAITAGLNYKLRTNQVDIIK